LAENHPKNRGFVGMEVTGPIVVKLFASSSAVDTDFTAKLVDVRPDDAGAFLHPRAREAGLFGVQHRPRFGEFSRAISAN
jgi:hypothetical protein